MFKKKDDLYHKQLEFNSKFNRLMFELNLFNKFNRTYRVYIDEETIYGLKGRIYNEAGLSFQDLEKHRNIIQENLQCLWIMEVIPMGKFANIKIIFNMVDENILYNPVKSKPYEMYMGLDFSHKPILNNMNQNCMTLLAGATGSGKTRFLYTVLLNWVCNCDPSEVELYLSDVAKNELTSFQHVKHVKRYAAEIDELAEMLRAVRAKLVKRKEILAPLRAKGVATDIKEYNETQDTKISYCYVFIDEFSAIMIDKSDTKEEKELKQEILDSLKYISKIGRNLGVFSVIATQKTTKDEIPAIVKNMSATRISFRANDGISSEVIIGDSSAVGLGRRVAVYSLNGGSNKKFLYCPKIETSYVTELLAPYRIANKPTTKSNEAQTITRRAYTKHLNLNEKHRVRPNFIATQANYIKSNHVHPALAIKEDECIDY